MAEELKRHPFQGVSDPTPKDIPHAPIIVFDAVPAGSVVNGMIGATLVVLRQMPEGDTLKSDVLVTGYLRCSPSAAKELVAHLQSAINLIDQQAKMMGMSGPPNA
jgi:hypothetical protein